MSSQLRRTLAAKSVSAIRKAKHNQKKKPYSEICHGMDQDTVNSLMVGFEPISATKQMTKWSLHGDEIYDLFPDLPDPIVGVKFDGKLLCLAGTRPYLAPEASCAEIESLELKYKPKEAMITLKYHTAWISGRRRQEILGLAEAGALPGIPF